MRPISVFLNEQKRCRLFGLTAACLLVLFQLCSVQTFFAQAAPTVTITQVQSNICGNGYECCVKFEVHIHPGTVFREFHFGISSTQIPAPTETPDACWDFICAESTSNWYVNPIPVYHPYVIVTGSSTGISFDFTVGNSVPGIVNSGTTDIIFGFMLCASQSCGFSDWTDITWGDGWEVRGSHIPYPTQGADFALTYCAENSDGGEPICPSCDRVDMDSPDSCYERICVTRHWPADPSTGVTFYLHIVPGLNGGCNHYGSSGCPYTSISIQEDFPYWSVIGELNSDTLNTSTGNPLWTNLTLQTSGIGLDGCEEVCVIIPKCIPAVSHVVTVYDPDDPSQCGESIGTAAFKKATPLSSSSMNSAASNYPNPLSWDNDFKTTIPFMLPNGGDATIKINDVTGRVINEETITFAGSGKHFFYFTATDLPAGKYFYQIEYPKGNVIVNKSMIVIK